MTETKSKIAVSIPEAADMIGVSRAMFYRLLASGGAPPTAVIGKRRVVPVASLERWLADHVQGAIAA